jgi:hypothetical protein
LLQVDEDELELPRDLSGLEVQLGRVASVPLEVRREKAETTPALEAGIAKSNQMLKKSRTKILMSPRSVKQVFLTKLNNSGDSV